MKKGMIYTIAIFLLASAIFELVIYTSQNVDRHAVSFLPEPDGRVLARRLNELSSLYMQSAGLNASLSRNSTNLGIHVQDAGFPLTDSSYGMAYLSAQKAWIETNWSNFTSCPALVNITIANTTGLLLSSSSQINYSQNNSATANDSATISIPSDASISSFDLSIYCHQPINASSIQYTDWASTGTWRRANISFSDNGARTHANAILFNPSFDHLFSAAYLDSNGNWLTSIHADLIRPNYTLIIWSDANSSYTPTLSKKNVSCSWNATLFLNYTNTSEQNLFAPQAIHLRCNNASYSGNITLSRK
ncbi:MAG: hypothetical protein WC492_03980 [Candidatus Micrarchaeia archaeon]